MGLYENLTLIQTMILKSLQLENAARIEQPDLTDTFLCNNHFKNCYLLIAIDQASVTVIFLIFSSGRGSRHTVVNEIK